MFKLFVTNTLGRKKEEFKPLKNNKVNLYACGVTPYDFSHIGHGRSFINVDVMVRFLRFLDFDVRYIRNITDIDDKLLKKAEAAGDINSYKEIANKFVKSTDAELEQLDCVKPDKEPKVTEHIPQIIKFIEQLIEKKKAYAVDGDVYFDVTSFDGYGKLSGRKVEDMISGARVEVNEKKKNPADFALWKGNDQELFWKSPWGFGRPGWHIECSVLAKEFLGESIDIHCGGLDLIFPHHENELAQSESLHGKIFAKYWLHNALLNIDKEKMSKSLGNILSLHEVLSKKDPMVVRFYFLQHHYRMPIEFSFEGLDSAEVAYKKIVNACMHASVNACVHAETKPDDVLTVDDARLRDCTFIKDMITALCDDFNTPKMIGILFEHLDEVKKSSTCATAVRLFWNQILGLTIDSTKKATDITPEIKKLIEERKIARSEKNWARADAIRDELAKLGYEAQDKKL
jgi:cysteinyl-tRNA synthetase